MCVHWAINTSQQVSYWSPRCRFASHRDEGRKARTEGTSAAKFVVDLQDCRATITGIRADCTTAELTEPNNSPANPPRP